MSFLLWIIACSLIAIGSYFIVMNWGVFINNYLKKSKWTSAIPFVGGALMALGIGLLPVDGSWRYAWIPFIIDWGSLPVLVASLLISKLGKT